MSNLLPVAYQSRDSTPLGQWRQVKTCSCIIYFISHFITACFIIDGSPVRLLLPMYLEMTVSLLYGWVTEISSRMFQSEVDELCDFLLGEGRVPWLLVCLANITVHALFGVCMIAIYGGMDRVSKSRIFFIILPLAAFFPCTFSAFLKYSSPLYYCLSKCSFTALLFDLSVDYLNVPEFDSYIRSAISSHFSVFRSYPWFYRGTLVIFTLIHYVLGLIVDCVDMGLAEVLCLDYLTGFLGKWATTSMVILGLSASYGLITKCSIAVGKYIVTGERDTALVLLRTDSLLTEQYLIYFFFFADVLTVDDVTRINNCRVLLLLLLCRIALASWECVEPDYFVLVNSGTTNKLCYLRLLFYAAIMTLVPAMLTYRAANYFNYDLWLLLNAAGNVIILCRVFFTLIELVLLHLSWFPEIQLDHLEDLIYFVRLSKNISIGITIFLWKYYCAMISVFSRWFLIHIAISVFDGVWSFKNIVYKEWIVFQTRRRFLNGLNNLPDASQQQLDNLQDVCSICFSEMQKGKVLQCSHIFHYGCLRRWFQVRRNCPQCNHAVILV